MIKLSVIIASYNRAANLVRALESLARQELDRDIWEVVAVDNNSSDDTAQRFADFAAIYPGHNFRMVSEPRQGLSHARNCGINNSAGEYIVIMDDDEEAAPGFLNAYFDFFTQNPQAAAAGGVMQPVYDRGKPRWMSFITEGFMSSAINLGKRQKPFPRGRYPIGGNFAFHRDMTRRYGLFDPELGRKGELLMAGEEKDFIDRIRRAGEQVWWLPQAVILHHIPSSRLTKEYFDKVTLMIGRSERIRTKNISAGAYRRRIFSEIIKWCAAMVLALGYTLTLRPVKGLYLIKMRVNITRGLGAFGQAG